MNAPFSHNALTIRRQFVLVETSLAEQGVESDLPLRKVAVAAVIKNPYAGTYAENLDFFIRESAALGASMAKAGLEAMGPYDIESYGKAAIIGLAGEQEHGIALITTPFGDALRAAIGGGAAWISSFSKRAAPGTPIDVPLAHKHALYVRSHYDGMTVQLPDAPLPDEVAIICCFANRGRLNHRLGGLAAGEIEGLDGLR
ncbi:amino acid synthesis family protein [Kaistia dalseonensis]|uniref:Amino acid synthesis family protein n=1 Tax=Kaistia dalseonensis TaxID=410840 RepID=A0ABU0H9R1_9HYPH|nr:amino acid synthesis family protein [Kaistia dalseonensis]MCX5496124.1 amino acid synthesis family protein [Kaistia dalseonensis]MDQ0438732.1 hypothetical protein [Kaistia dalseonensis]